MASENEALENEHYKSALQNLLSKDLGRESYFNVIFGKHSKDGKLITDNFSRNLVYLCHSAELPGESLATINQKIYGVIEQFPLITGYSNVTLSFYLTGSDYDEVRISFLSWLTYITGRQQSININDKFTSFTTYNTPYKDDITATIQINHYSIKGDLLTKCWLIDAFPIQISESRLNWANRDYAMSLNVTFAYTEYEYYFYGKDNSTSIQPFNKNLKPNIYATPQNPTVQTTLPLQQLT